MYTLKVIQNFYDKEHPGVLLHTGETLTTEDGHRAKHLVELGFAVIVNAPEEGAPAAVKAPEAPAEGTGNEGNSAEKAPEEGSTVEVAGGKYPVSNVRNALNLIGVKTAGNAGVKALNKKVSELSEEQVTELMNHLSE